MTNIETCPECGYGTMLGLHCVNCNYRPPEEKAKLVTVYRVTVREQGFGGSCIFEQWENAIDEFHALLDEDLAVVMVAESMTQGALDGLPEFDGW